MPAPTDFRPPRWRRPLMIMVGVFVLLVLLIVISWYAVLPHWRPPRGPGEMFGIDVSNHQGEIDWSQVRDDGVDFAYLKATEGKDWVDPYFARNWGGGKNAGIRVGAYHFFTLCAPGADQAANFLRVAPPEENALPPAIDLELIGPCTERPPAKQVEAELGAFLRTVEGAWGRPLVIYVRQSWSELYPLGEDERPRWRTSFFVRPSKTWAIWQVHSFGHVAGVKGRVDIDIARADSLH